MTSDYKKIYIYEIYIKNPSRINSRQNQKGAFFFIFGQPQRSSYVLLYQISSKLFQNASIPLTTIKTSLYAKQAGRQKKPLIGHELPLCPKIIPLLNIEHYNFSGSNSHSLGEILDMRLIFPCDHNLIIIDFKIILWSNLIHFTDPQN